MAGVDVEIRLFGAVEIVVAGRRREVGPAQQQLLLAALAAEPGRPVAVEVLLDRIWDDPPDGARRTLPVLVSRLRRVLGQAGQPAAQVLRRSGSYLLEVDPERVDVYRMRALADQARDPALDAPARAELLREAVSLWRGEPLTGLSAIWADRVREVWRRQYVDVVVAWGNAELAAGDPEPVAALAGAQAGEYPLSEALVAVQIRALAAAGRPAEALEVYAAVRARLADELGVDPGSELAALHQAILRGEPVVPARVGGRPTYRGSPAGRTTSPGWTGC